MPIVLARLMRRPAAMAVVTGLALAGLLVPAPAQAQSAGTRYERALAREKAARDTPRTTVAQLRSLATTYERITRQYPRSGYSDNALWQAAGLLDLAYDRGGSRRDRDKAIALLKWLKREYPSSSLVKQVDTRIAAITAPPASHAPVATARATPAPAAAAPPRATTTPAVTAPDATATLREVTHVALRKGDRLTLELTGESLYTATRQAAPDRLVLAMPHAQAAAGVAQRADDIRGALVRSLEVASDDGGLQLRVDLRPGAHYSTFPLYNPYRLVIDIESDDPAFAAASAPVSTPLARPASATTRTEPPAAVPAVASAPVADDDRTTKPAPPASTSAGRYSLARQLGLGVSRIVIDPGHGGHDPGAQANGVSEADLVLDISLRVAHLLEAEPGIQVVLTRRTDTFIPLEERTAIANRESADLFVSIHANSSPHKDTRGIETYFLNFATNSRAEAVAARENASSGEGMRILPELVKTIAMNNKVAESRELATMLETSLMRRLSVRDKGLKDLGVKQAPFVVLIGAQMPSVLAEIAFLSNKSEAKLLKQDAYRQRIAQALCDGILKYQGSLKKVTTVAGITEGR